jgi:hypothetical protein
MGGRKERVDRPRYVMISRNARLSEGADYIMVAPQLLLNNTKFSTYLSTPKSVIGLTISLYSICMDRAIFYPLRIRLI